MSRAKKTKLSIKKKPLNLWRTLISMPQKHRYKCSFCSDCFAFLTGNRKRKSPHPNLEPVKELFLKENIGDHTQLRDWVEDQEVVRGRALRLNVDHNPVEANLNNSRSLPDTPQRSPERVMPGRKEWLEATWQGTPPHLVLSKSPRHRKTLTLSSLPLKTSYPPTRLTLFGTKEESSHQAKLK